MEVRLRDIQQCFRSDSEDAKETCFWAFSCDAENAQFDRRNCSGPCNSTNVFCAHVFAKKWTLHNAQKTSQGADRKLLWSLIGSLDNIIIAVTVSVLMGTEVTSFSREAWSGAMRVIQQGSRWFNGRREGTYVLDEVGCSDLWFGRRGSEKVWIQTLLLWRGRDQ